MLSYKISEVQEKFLEKFKILLIGKVQGKEPLTTVMDMLFKNLGANSKLQEPGE